MLLTPEQSHILGIAEQVASCFSVVGAAFIISTFLLNSDFHKPINRLAFYATFGNLGANIATFISQRGLALGGTSALCQFQGFLIQWFMPADAMWTLAMACNVYLSLFRHYDAARLRTLEWKYLVFNYGLPFIFAFVYCFIHTEERGHVYGPATLWCWIGSPWQNLRIATLYGPVWVIIGVIAFIYIRVGIVIFRYRHQMLSVNEQDARSSVQSRHSISGIQDADFVASAVPKELPGAQVAVVDLSNDGESSSSSASSATISNFKADVPAVAGPNMSRQMTRQSNFLTQTLTRVDTSVFNRRQSAARAVEANKVTLNYCKCAVLFFLALTVTWVPSTVTRVYSLWAGDKIPFALYLTSGIELPLQGFWNAVIYIATSLPATKALFSKLGGSCRRARPRREQADIESSDMVDGATLSMSPRTGPSFEWRLRNGSVDVVHTGHSTRQGSIDPIDRPPLVRIATYRRDSISILEGIHASRSSLMR